MMKAACFFCITILFISCKSNAVPKDVLPKEKMEAVLWDYISADMYVKNMLVRDSANNIKEATYRLQEKVFAKNNTDRNTFTKSYNWYQSHDAVLMPMLDSIAAKQARNVEKERSAGRKKLEQSQIQ